jgi:hypothetical protein
MFFRQCFSDVIFHAQNHVTRNSRILLPENGIVPVQGGIVNHTQLKLVAQNEAQKPFDRGHDVSFAVDELLHLCPMWADEE